MDVFNQFWGWVKSFFVGVAPGDIAGEVAAIVTLCKSLCKFEPEIEAVTAMVAAANPAVAGAEAIAHAICQVVNTAVPLGGAKDTMAVFPGNTVNGVTVVGTYTTKK